MIVNQTMTIGFKLPEEAAILSEFLTQNWKDGGWYLCSSIGDYVYYERKTGWSLNVPIFREVIKEEENDDEMDFLQ